MNIAQSAAQPFPPPSAMLSADISLSRGQTTFAPGHPASKQTDSQRNSAILALEDPISKHLLVETALADSKTFDVLSHEELDGLKKEDGLLITRIDGIRHKLLLESKVRDAAKSMNKLYVGHGMESEASKREREDYEASERNCEELGKEMFTTMQRSWTLQMKLARHAAAVLAVTYGNGHRPRVDLYGLPGGRPASPDSDSNKPAAVGGNLARERNWDEVFEYDDNFEAPDGFVDESRTPAARQQREQQMAIGKRLEELNGFVHEILGQVNPQSPVARVPSPKLTKDAKQVDASILDQLNSLSRGLNEIKEEQRSLKMERNFNSRPSTPKTPKMDIMRQQETELDMQQRDQQMTRMLMELNSRFAETISTSASSEPLPPIPTPEFGSGAQLKFAQDRLNSITRMLKSLSAMANQSHNVGNSQYDAVLEGLWQMMKSIDQDLKTRNQEERNRLEQRRRAGEDVDDSEAELSPDEDDEDEQYSLSAFSTKVQWLASKSTYLREKHSDLRRRMRQLRCDLEEREQARSEEVDALSRQLGQLDDAKEQAREELQRAQLRLNEHHEQSQRQGDELSSTRLVLDDLRQQLRTREQESDLIQSQLNDATKKHIAVRDRLQLAEQSILKWEADHAVALRQRDVSDMQAKEATQNHDLARRDLDTFEGELARLTTELTIAKADLDAAQGKSRNERAVAERTARDEAEAHFQKLLITAEDRERKLQSELESVKSQHEEARLKAQDADIARARIEQQYKAKGIDDSAGKAREDELRRELEATLKEFEELTRASVEAEKEREELEKAADSLRERTETLEGQLSEERISKLGSTTSAASTGSVRNSGDSDRAQGSSTSALVLKNEFKKMMREARAEHQKALKHEQEERRKAETQLRNLKATKRLGP